MRLAHWLRLAVSGGGDVNGDCFYFQRCQLVYGAATLGGQLNRTSLAHCADIPIPSAA